MRELRTPKEILDYGTDIIQKYRHELYDLKHELMLYASDYSNNQRFYYNYYGIWKHKVKDYIAKHEKDKIEKIDSLFDSFENSHFAPEYLSDILGILHISINHLESEENGGSPDNSQTAQTTNETERHNEFEPEPNVENLPKEKKKIFTWKRVLFILIVVIAIIAAFYYYRIDLHSAAAIATIIGAIFAVLSFIFK